MARLPVAFVVALLIALVPPPMARAAEVRSSSADS
jgi:hypothetical protein